MENCAQANLRPTKRLNRVDLPTFGRPTIATSGSRFCSEGTTESSRDDEGEADFSGFRAAGFLGNDCLRDSGGLSSAVLAAVASR
jgi:hypothetical protein